MAHFFGDLYERFWIVCVALHCRNRDDAVIRECWRHIALVQIETFRVFASFDGRYPLTHVTSKQRNSAVKRPQVFRCMNVDWSLPDLSVVVSWQKLPLGVRPIIGLPKNFQLTPLFKGHFFIFRDVADKEIDTHRIVNR